MTKPLANPVVHLELRTVNLSRACAFYTELFGWSVDTVRVGSQTYLALELGKGIRGGVAECESEQTAWLPYVEVAEIAEATERGRRLSATVTLEPREGPAGWRSVFAVSAGAESRCGDRRFDHGPPSEWLCISDLAGRWRDAGTTTRTQRRNLSGTRPRC